MASKKSKILAIAFCAAVMAGIHVNPVLAGSGYYFDTDTHVKAETYKADENGNVTMAIVDKNDKDTGKKVTISGLASDKELADQKSEFEAADKDLKGQIDKNAGDIEELGGKVDGINKAIESGALKGEKGQDGKDGVDGKDGASIASGEYNVQDGTGIVQMPIEDEDGNKVGDVQINNIASQNDLKDETAARQEADNEIKADLQADINAKEEQSKGRDSQLQANIDAEAEKRKNEDDKLQADINAKEEQSKGRDSQLQANIDAEAEKRKNEDDKLQADINAKEEQSKYRDAQLQQSIDNHEAVMGVTDKTGLESAYKGATYIDEKDTMVEADRKLDAAISDVNSRVDGLSSRVDRLDDRIDKVGAMAAAIANLHTMGYDPAAPTEVAVGVGQYRDETGMALGLFHYPNRDFMLSLSVSTSGDEYMGGIGATWKFGRKSPEKVAEIKKAQAEADARRAEEQKLAKAEEMKKAAKEAKVQAQMERHAKLAAERAALEEA